MIEKIIFRDLCKAYFGFGFSIHSDKSLNANVNT